MEPQCPDCDEDFDSFDAVAAHRIKVHSSIDVGEDGDITPANKEEAFELEMILNQEAANKHPEAYNL